ncbi:MAG: glycine rich domain-containing protein, partial [Streptosporangiaceae bacterium]
MSTTSRSARTQAVKSRRRIVALAAGAVSTAALAVASPATAGAATTALPSGCIQSGQTVTCTYDTPGQQTFTVPAGVTAATFDLYGAQGGSGELGQAPGGNGAHVHAILPLTPGQALQLMVGGQGSDNETGGFNGGGSGTNTGNTSAASGGGGGATDIRQSGTSLANRVLVAAGGGGGGGCVSAPAAPASCFSP